MPVKDFGYDLHTVGRKTYPMAFFVGKKYDCMLCVIGNPSGELGPPKKQMRFQICQIRQVRRVGFARVAAHGSLCRFRAIGLGASFRGRKV